MGFDYTIELAMQCQQNKENENENHYNWIQSPTAY